MTPVVAHVEEICRPWFESPRVVRHLSLRGQAGDAATGDVPRRCEGVGWMLERPPVVPFEVAVTSIVEPDRVNIDFATALVA